MFSHLVLFQDIAVVKVAEIQPQIFLYYIINIMLTDGLAMQGV